MKEKLIIKNFGPIKSIELDLGRFNVLIGEQATGKSTVAKVLAMCRFFSYIIQNDSERQSFEAGLQSWGLHEAIQDNSYIYYNCRHYSVTIERQIMVFNDRDQQDGSYFENGIPIFSSKLKAQSNEFINLLTELNKIRPHKAGIVSLDDLEWDIPTSFFQNDVAKVMDNPFYLPTERGLQSIFSLGKGSIQNISDALFNQLADIDRVARLFTTDTEIEPLDVVYKNEQGRGFVRKSGEDKFFSMFNAASGYQSTIPAVLVTNYYNEIKKKKKTFIVEEPELNLFPSAQQRLMQYFVNKVMNYGNSILLTTHSPYVLASLNNMLYAYKTGQTNGEAVNAIISDKCWLKPSEFSAYRLLNDGTYRNIIDNELEEIIVEELDAAGKEINADYDKILAIKFGRNEELK